MQGMLKYIDLAGVQARENGLVNLLSPRKTIDEPRSTKIGVCANLVDRKINELAIQVSSLNFKA